MKKLSKELQKRVSNGDFGSLIDGIEKLLDMYHATPFDDGYESCMNDMSARAYRLAEHLKNKSSLIGHKPRKGENVYVIEVDDLAKAIEEYFENALKA